MIDLLMSFVCGVYVAYACLREQLVIVADELETKSQVIERLAYKLAWTEAQLSEQAEIIEGHGWHGRMAERMKG